MKSPYQAVQTIKAQMAKDAISLKLMANLVRLHDEFNTNVKLFLQKVPDVKELERIIESKVGPRGLKGEKGDTPEIDYEHIINVLKDYLPPGQVGPKGKDGRTPVRGVDYFTELDVAEIISRIKVEINSEKPKETKEMKLGAKYDNDGKKQTERAFQHQTQNGYFHGGGVPSLRAGSGITLVQMPDGGYTVVNTASGAGTAVSGEDVSGSGTAWTLANTPTAGTLKLFANGQRLKLTADYSIVGANITTVQSWDAGSLLADYTY